MTKRTTLKLKMTTMAFSYRMATYQMTKECKIAKKRTRMTVMNGKLQVMPTKPDEIVMPGYVQYIL